MNNKIKGVEFVWLSETDLTNLNSGEGGTNVVDVKKYQKHGIEYPYVSGQAMRHYLREAIRRDINGKQFMCTPNDKGENCGESKTCLNCDLFGYMLPQKDVGAKVRVSPVKVSPAIGLCPLEENSTVDFLTRKKRKEEGEKSSGDIVNIELGVNLYKCGISIDIQRIGVEEELDEKTKKIRFKEYTKLEEKVERIKAVISSIRFISDYSKQSRLLTDFTPDILIASEQFRYSHRLQKALRIDNKNNLDTKRLIEIVNDVNSYSKVHIGMLSNVINNEKEVRQVIEETGLTILSIDTVIQNILNNITIENI